MNKSFRFNFFIIFIVFLLTLNDILCFSLCKYIYLHNLNIYYLILPTIMYGLHIPLFFYGLRISSMAVLNIVWNLLSSILVLLLGIIYFKEKISWIKIIALGMGLCSLGLLTIDYF